MKQILSNRYFINCLLLAVLIRLFVMPFFYHPDIKTYNFQASFLQKGVLDIYSYLPSHKDELALKEEFVYFPLTYFALGIYQWIVSPLLGPDFYQWLKNASASSTEQLGVFRYLFILKLPYLVLDIVIAFLLTLFFSNENLKRRVFTIWLFNPFSIILIYIYSNVDIFPVFLTILCLFFVKKGNLLLAGLCLGLGAGFKIYPLVFIPFLFFLAEKWKDRLLILIASLIPFLLITAPFLNSIGFQQATLASGLTTRIISNGIPIGFGEVIYPGLVLLFGVYFLAWQKKINFQRLPLFSFLILMSIFMSIHFHIQWLLWIVPFAALILATRQNWIWNFIFLITTAMLIPLFYDDSSMTVSTLSVISPLFGNLSTPFKITQHFLDPTIIQSILHSIFFGLGITIFILLFKEEKV